MKSAKTMKKKNSIKKIGGNVIRNGVCVKTR